jgi:hypothetical protein
MANTYKQRYKIAQDTVKRTPAIVQSVPGASLESTFFAEQIPEESLPPLDPDSLARPAVKVEVINCDSFTAARNIIKELPDAEGKTAVLNLASDIEPGGGWIETLLRTQVRF